VSERERERKRRGRERGVTNSCSSPLLRNEEESAEGENDRGERKEKALFYALHSLSRKETEREREEEEERREEEV
jgi:hypothetical protein